jgi:diguanylate cyclase (GGDEF)-like protein
MLQQFGFLVVVTEEASKFPITPLAFLCALENAADVRQFYPKADIIAVVDNPGLDERLAAVRVGCRATVASDVDATELGAAMERLVPLELEVPRVLIVDDDSYVSQRTAIVLEQVGLEVTILTDPKKLLERVAETRPHLVIMDMRLPGCTGLELAAVLRQDDRMVGVPIVFLTAEDRPARALEALQVGADDFLVKPVASKRLVSVVLSRLERSRVLRSFMDHDSLTRLLSHARTLERLEAEVTGAQRRGEALCLAILDLDHFKLVNDKYGHATGDRVLRSLSTVLRRRARRTDVIGRCGGEEFAIILSGANGKDACRLVNERREMFAALHYTTPTGPMSCTFSAGVAELQPGDTSATLWDRADVALYDAKRAGRNRVELAIYILKEDFE